MIWRNPEISHEVNPDIEPFNRAVALGYVTVSARKGGKTKPFKLVRADDWIKFKVTDWKNGNAINADGMKLFEIHGSIRSGQRRGPKPKLDWDGDIRLFVFDFLERNGFAMESTPVRGLQAMVERAILESILST